MMDKKQWKVQVVADEQHEIARYSNFVAVTSGEHEVILTFSQIVFPVVDTEDAKAKPIAKIAVPYAVAESMSQLISAACKSEK